MAQVYRGGQLHGTGRPNRFTPHDAREFDRRRFGADPNQVREFQALVAEELAALLQEIRMLSQENDRLKRALRDRQTMHARECWPPQEFPINDGRW